MRTIVNPLRVLLFGNLLLLVIEKQLRFFTTQNIYVVGALLLNIFLILELVKVSKMPKSYSLFFLLAMLGLISAYLALDPKIFVVVIVKYIWILTSVLLLNHLFTASNFKFSFEELSKFVIFVGYFIIVNNLLTILTVNEPYVVNEGFKSLLISSDHAKKLAIVSLPFLFLGEKRHFLCGMLLIFYLLLATRAAMLTASLSVFFIMFRFLNMRSGDKINPGIKIKHRWLLVIMIFFVVGSALNLAVKSRLGDITSFISTADRIANWSRYSQVFVDYPLGLGPEGGYYLLRKNPERIGVDISYLTELAIDQDLETGTDTSIEKLIDKRLMVSAKIGTRSSESLYFDFICSFGLVGLLLLIHLVFVLFKDFKYAVTSFNPRFPLVYGSFGSLMVYGLFNSFHSSMFFLLLLYVIYFLSRNEYIAKL